MKPLDITFSEKNIVLTNLHNYRRALLNEVEKFIERVRWRVFFFKNPDLRSKSGKETYGLKTANLAPSDNDLKEFERRLDNIIKNIKFKQMRPNQL